MTDGDGNKPGVSRPTLSHRLEYIAFLSIRWMFGRLTVAQSAALSAFIWRLVAPRLRRHKRAMINLTAALPDLNERQRAIILNGMWDNLGRTSAEALRLDEIADDSESVSLDFSVDALTIMNSAQPAIFVSLHYGNWEVTAIAAERFKKPLLGIYKKVDNPLVDVEVFKMRSRFYKGGLLSRAPETMRKVSRAIREGYSVAIMADLRDSHGGYVPFFGIPSRATHFPALLSRLHDLPIIAIKADRTGPGKFKISAEKIDLINSSNRQADIVENTARIQLQLEKWIKMDPALWMWGHRRWNSDSFSQSSDLTRNSFHQK